MYKREAREKLLQGAKKLADTVGVTMGPQGKNVILTKFAGAPVLTKDGVSVAREITLQDPIEELSVQMIKEVAGRTAALAGDGTTTATVLAYELFTRGNDLINQNYSPLKLKRGVEWAVERIVDNLDSMSTKIDELRTLTDIASISANNDYELGSKIAEAFHAVGLDGTVAAEAAPGVKTSIRYVDGIEIPAGMSSPSFLVEDGKTEVVIDKCHILICADEITTLAGPIMKVLNEMSERGMPLLLLAKAVKQEALQVLVANNKAGRFKNVCVNLPLMGIAEESIKEWLEAKAALVGGRVFGSAYGHPISDASISDLGFANRVVVGKYQTKILEGRRDEERVAKKLELYEEDAKKLVSESGRQDIRKRIALLKNKAAIITVGYSTELELREKGDRVDDALCATRAAVEEGFVPGGGTALLRASIAVDLSECDPELLPAAKVVIEACKAPITRISSNAFEDPEEVITTVLSHDGNYGFNAANGKYEDLVKAGVIDPKKVTRTALQNAASISMLLINTDAVVYDIPDTPSSWQPPAGWRPPETGKMSHKY